MAVAIIRCNPIRPSGEDRHVRQAAQVGQIEDPLVRLAVVADQPGTVEREDDRQILDADVVGDLIECALQERRVDRRHRAHPAAREARREGDRVLLGNPHVEEALGIGFLELVEARAGRHRRRDPDDPLIAVRLRDQRLREDILVFRRGRLRPPAGLS
jgi:hypothetical protein